MNGGKYYTLKITMRGDVEKLYCLCQDEHVQWRRDAPSKKKNNSNERTPSTTTDDEQQKRGKKARNCTKQRSELKINKNREIKVFVCVCAVSTSDQRQSRIEGAQFVDSGVPATGRGSRNDIERGAHQHHFILLMQRAYFHSSRCCLVAPVPCAVDVVVRCCCVRACVYLQEMSLPLSRSHIARQRAT